MKILHINTNDKGGAATACIRIHLELLNRGIDSKILFLNRTKAGIPQSYKFPKKNSLAKRAGAKIGKVFLKKREEIRTQYPQVEWFTDPRSKYDITEHPLYMEADIIQLNWVSGFLDEPSFFKKNTKPVVWRMADLYACGGGYHYEKGFPFRELRDTLAANTELRVKALQDTNITFVPISNWVLEKANESEIIGSFPKRVIHNGLDFSIFKSIDKIAARTLFNLPMDRKVVLLGAHVANSERKGFDLAIKALARIDSDVLQPVVFGDYRGELPSHFIRTGYVGDDRLLAALYGASDFFLMSSIEEAFGQVTIEALACGVPVVSFPTGGSLDSITNYFNGIIAKDFTAAGLAEALSDAMNETFDSEEIIKDIHQRFSIQEKIDQYIELYKQLLKN